MRTWGLFSTCPAASFTAILNLTKLQWMVMVDMLNPFGTFTICCGKQGAFNI
ncbi:hypothetical protein SLEP1_g40358 [Rubroshorea leprosula]|uniref:Uncharacterized protein n=1 Tax=Rubroshorea leprosula TaxID=152421 RepID=A0AAV5L3B1_9ROSI|nr:hypothetical protein SLEP1_g6004 [Rubroshorea leprosula]GKV31686.1 hypothetical protein SLEP1_g40358 [Rubroshorea leprosula]